MFHVKQRPRLTDCRYEPGYSEHETVMFSMGAPDLVCHRASARCGVECPHGIAECGEFLVDAAVCNEALAPAAPGQNFPRRTL